MRPYKSMRLSYLTLTVLGSKSWTLFFPIFAKSFAVPETPYETDSPARRAAVAGVLTTPITPYPNPFTKPPKPPYLAPYAGLEKKPDTPEKTSDPIPQNPCFIPSVILLAFFKVLKSCYPAPCLTKEYIEPVKLLKLWAAPPIKPLTSPYMPVPIPKTKA